MRKLIFVAVVILTLGILFMTCQEAMSPEQVSQEADPPQIESCPPTYPPEKPESCGRMTGGGSVFFEENGIRVRVTRGFEIHCDLSEPNNLQVNWQGGNKFHLTELTGALCTDDPAIIQDPPAAPFDTFIGDGYGRLTIVGVGKDIVGRIHFIFVDEGEPGINDTASIEIWYMNGDEEIEVLNVDGPIDRGNLQAHDDKCP